MATLISLGGNFTTAGSWALADSTSENDVETGSTALTTSYVLSSTFTPGAITIDGIAVKLASRAASPTGTISIALDQGGATVTGTEITINVSDLNVNGNGWYVFKFASSVLLLAATAYSVKAKTSSAAQANLFRGAGTNWARELRTTTTQAPAAGDKLIIAGEHTGAGTGNDVTITMNSTATTSYGSTAFLQSISVNKRGTLAYGTAASTAYYLKYKGVFTVFGAGTFTIGTSGTPIPSTSSAVFEFDVASNVDTGLVVAAGGIFESRGNTITNVKAFLNADAAIAATSLTTDISTGWLSGDEIILASTTRTNTECEKVTLSGNASGTTVPVSATAAAHSGSGATKAEIANQTRNVKIRGLSTSLQGYISIATTASYTSRYTEHYFMGSATGGKRGIDIATTTGSCDIQYGSFHDFVVASSILFNVAGASSNNITLSNNVSFNIAVNHFTIVATTGSSITVDSNLFIRSLGTGINLTDVGLTLTNNTVVGSTGAGMALNEAAIIGTISGNTCHSNSTNGILINSITGGTISTSTLWRNTGIGMQVSSASGKILVDTLTAFGNGNASIDISNAYASLIELRFVSLTLNAGTTLTTPVGISMNSTQLSLLIVDNSTFGVTTTHSTADINIAGTFRNVKRLIIRNCNLASTNKVSPVSNLNGGCYVGQERAGQTAGNHFAQFSYADGIIGRYDIDTTIFDTTPSLKVTPAHATLKCETTRFRSAVANSASLTVSVKVRKSVIGDGAAYSGNQLRLMVAANPALGINSDTVLATSTNAANGAFELISGATAAVTDNGVLEFFVDGDGTTGFFNIDTLTVS